MTLLHVYFQLRNQKAFKRLLDAGPARGQSSAGLSSSGGGKSWSKTSSLSALEVNARDDMGRTVLHLAAAAQDPAALEYVHLLLAHPNVNINLFDKENHWTALHRAVYHGNLTIARLLLQRAEIDTSLKDIEGYTAFDLYNSTLEGTKPVSDDTSIADLFTWGANRNAALGVGNGDDRAHPELVSVRPADAESDSLDARFAPVHVRQIAMSRLHTAVVTSESRSNVRVCGFGSGGRLGPGQHTQYHFIPLPQFTQTVVSVAAGQDHTLALTKSGEVFSWGLNRFSQLGYVVEASIGGRLEEPIQSTARKVSGPLKNKVVKGVAACKTASSCWTSDEVFTWGTNNGQLGYDKSAHPIQVVPRVVAKVTQPVLSVIITDSALACLLVTQDVVCICNDGYFKVNFPLHGFPSEISVYRPPHATNNTCIQKITGCDNTMAALSSNGELFTFSAPTPADGSGGGSGRSRATIVPQRVWALRKQFSAVKDVALGSDGSIIVCTESGHVFVRSRNLKASQTSSAKTFKFQRVPYIQRVVGVCANVTGAYGALRVDHKPSAVGIVGNLIAQDISGIQPYLRPSRSAARDAETAVISTVSDLHEVPIDADTAQMPMSHGRAHVAQDAESDDEQEDLHIQKDIKQMQALCMLLSQDKAARASTGGGIFADTARAHGADLKVQVRSGFEFHVHRVILAARCAVLEQVLSGSRVVEDTETKITIRLVAGKSAFTSKCPKIAFMSCHPLSVLILVAYLYTDEILALWDRRIGSAIEPQLVALKIKPADIKVEVQALARLLDMSLLGQAVEPPAKRDPAPSMAMDMGRLFDTSQTQVRRQPHPLAPDVVLQLQDRALRCHSVILRARSPFFAAFFDDGDWTVNRWTSEGTIVVNLTHLRWRVMEYVLGFLCCGGDSDMFEVLTHVNTVDELLDFMFDVIAAANELLLDRLILICSEVILKRISITNVCSVLADATYFHVLPLVRSLQEYIAANMETLLESRMLDDLTPDLIRQLSVYIREQQERKYPVTRSGALVDKAMAQYGDWIALQDIPQPLVPTIRAGPGPLQDGPRLSPPGPMRRYPVSTSPTIRPQPATPPGHTTPIGPPDEGVFVMDEAECPATPPAARARVVESPSKPSGGWKPISSAPRLDMRAIIAEAETSKMPAPPSTPTPISRMPSGGELRAGTARAPPAGPAAPDRRTGGAVARPSDSPWRLPRPLLSTTPPQPHTMPAPTTSGKGQAGASASVSSVPAPTRQPPSPSPRKAGAAGAPGLGPVFSPARQAPPAKGASSPSIRKASGGKVWTLPPVQPSVQASPVAPPGPAGAPSFVAIQELQAAQGSAPGADRRSLRKIQEEERAEQVEADFLRWWAAEEERLRVEAEQQAQAQKRAPKNRKPRGGGKGKRQQQQQDASAARARASEAP